MTRLVPTGEAPESYGGALAAAAHYRSPDLAHKRRGAMIFAFAGGRRITHRRARRDGLGRKRQCVPIN